MTNRSDVATGLPIAFSSAQAGKARRLARIFGPNNKGSVIVPVDDSLIFGPANGLEDIDAKVQKILIDPPDAILAFPGLFRNKAGLVSKVAGIVNITASTSASFHTRKVQVGSVQQAVQLGLDGVAVHVNISSEYESEMLRILGSVSQDCEAFGMPLLAIMYPRSESQGKDNNYDELRLADRKRYTELVAHASRVGVDLGADLIKTKFTGDSDSFSRIVDACRPVPVFVAGGPVLPAEAMLKMAYDVMLAGGKGISFGRNVFSRTDPTSYISSLKAIVHQGATVVEALQLCRESLLTETTT